MNHGETFLPYRQAASVLPDAFRRAAEGANEPARRRAEEFRLRLGAPMTIVLEDEEHESDSPPVTEADLRTVLEQGQQGICAHGPGPGTVRLCYHPWRT